MIKREAITADSAVVPHIIPYVVLSGKRPSRNLLEAAPNSFYNGTLETFSYLPQSFLQLLNPRTSHEILGKFGRIRGYQVNYFFNDAYENLKNISREFAVFILDTADALHQNVKFETLANNYLVFAPDQSIFDLLRKTHHNLAVIADTPESLRAKLNHFGRRYAKSGTRIVDDHQGIYINEIPAVVAQPAVIDDFYPSRINNLVRLNFGKDGWSGASTKRIINQMQRSERIAESIDELLRDKTPLVTDVLILVTPSWNSDLDKIKIEMLGAIDHPEGKKEITRTKMRRKAVQNCHSYLWEINRSEVPEEVKFFEEASESTKVLARSLDALSFLHSSFKCSPILRTPFTGVALNSFLSRFSPSQIGRIRNNFFWSDEIHKLGMACAATLTEHSKNVILNTSPAILAISDLPVEWLYLNGTPLAFLKDVCRIPQTSVSSVMTQYVRNASARMVLPRNVVAKTLVICSVPDDRMIRSCFEAIPRKNSSEATFATVSSIEELSKVVKDFNPDVLILFTHGRARKDSNDTVLEINGVDITNSDIVEHRIFAPVVILFACETAPINECLNPISQSFFENGALSVVSTLLPISARRAALACGMYLRYLDSTLFPNFVSLCAGVHRRLFYQIHLGRLIEDSKLRSKFSREDLDLSKSEEWYDIVDDPTRRAEAYRTVKDSVVSSLPDVIRKDASNILTSKTFEPESLYFTVLGRADLIEMEGFVPRWASQSNV